MQATTAIGTDDVLLPGDSHTDTSIGFELIDGIGAFTASAQWEMNQRLFSLGSLAVSG